MICFFAVLCVASAVKWENWRSLYDDVVQDVRTKAPAACERVADRIMSSAEQLSPETTSKVLGKLHDVRQSIDDAFAATKNVKGEFLNILSNLQRSVENTYSAFLIVGTLITICLVCFVLILLWAGLHTAQARPNVIYLPKTPATSCLSCGSTEGVPCILAPCGHPGHCPKCPEPFTQCPLCRRDVYHTLVVVWTE